MAQRTISNRDDLRERIRVENRIWDAINRLERDTSPEVIQQSVKQVATQVVQQVATQVVQQATASSGSAVVYLVENNGGEIVYDEEGHAKLYPYQIGG